MHPTPASISERPVADFFRCPHPAGWLGSCHWALKTCVASFFIRGQGSWWWEAEKTWHAAFVTFFFLNNWGLRRCKACVSVIKLEMWLPSSQSGFFPILTGMWEPKQKEMTAPQSRQIHTGACAVGLSWLWFSLASLWVLLCPGPVTELETNIR